MAQLKSLNWLKNKKRLVQIAMYMTAVVAFIVMFVNANQIIGALQGDLRMVRLEDYEKNAFAIATLTQHENYDDLAETVYVAGWGFANTKLVDEDKEIKLVLASDKKCYEVELSMRARFDVVAMYKQSYDISSGEIGFYGDFSTIGLDNGEYTMYLYCREHEDAKGLTPLNYVLNKNGRKVSIKQAEMKLDQVDALPEDMLNGVTYSLDVLSINEEGVLKASGWAFCETTGNNIDKTIDLYLKSENGIYKSTCLPAVRRDVYNAFVGKKNVQDVGHGFRFVVDVSNLPVGEYEMFLAVNETESERGLRTLKKIVSISEDGIYQVN